ncbi:hypothetical protein, partial [Bacillus paralicheniformis]|uniref:hypothetical protein n=1 Tax=Bacillus paralicheniformis TaxID=1648923 RepID=UPI002DBE01ED
MIFCPCCSTKKQTQKVCHFSCNKSNKTHHHVAFLEATDTFESCWITKEEPLTINKLAQTIESSKALNFKQELAPPNLFFSIYHFFIKK